MDPGEVEFSSLVGWLRTFSLESQASSAVELSDGEAMAEALVKIEPSVFTPAWFAGILQSDNSNNETLNSVLNLLLHYYRHNLGEDCASGELPVPVILPASQLLSTEMVARFLKLMLGVAVTCSNKQTFIDKIQSLDETTQHALTACVASFIYTKEWTGRVSAQSLNSDLKMATPPGDEVWAQKCHELDFQVALLKEERSNLIVENEDLYGKVKAAQTLSRKDSVKARQFETELAHIKDEFERLRLAYESTKEHIDNMETRLKPEGEVQSEKMRRLTKETADLRTELAGLKAGLASGRGERGESLEAGQVMGSLQEQREAIAELRAMIEFQAGLGREMNCLKDQVDVLRESSHSYTRHEQELVEIRSRLSHFQLEGEDITDLLHRQKQSRTLMSLESETNLSSQSSEKIATASNDLQDTSMLSQRNNLLEETLVQAVQLPVQEEGEELDGVVGKHVEELGLQYREEEGRKYTEEVEVRQLVERCQGSSLQEELRLLQAGQSGQSGARTPEQVDSGMDMTSESTPFTSRPESELVLGDVLQEEEVEATPRQLEMLLEESNSASSNSSNFSNCRNSRNSSVSQSVSPDSGLQLELQEVHVREVGMSLAEATVLESKSLLRSQEDHVRLLEREKEALVKEKEQLLRTSRELLSQDQLPFDPNDPKVKELEEWECSISRSVIVEDYPRNRLKNMFKMKKRSPKLKLRRAGGGQGMEERSLLERKEWGEEELVSLGCVNSWLLSFFVKVFD